MSEFTASESDSEFLDSLFESALGRIEDGHEVNAQEFTKQRPGLEGRILEAIRTAREVANTKQRTYPQLAGYALLAELGRGGMGTVYLARQRSLGDRLVALKVLPTSNSFSTRARDRFETEATAIARLRHPNVVSIHDVIHENGVHAYAMEWVDGKSLAQLIEHLQNLPFDNREVPLGNVFTFLGSSEQPVAAETSTVFFCRLGIAIARALGAVHREDLTHRDVKPSNILLRRDGTPLLTDFGLARETDTTIVTQTGHFVGTPAYASPEQLRGDHDRVDSRSDIYSLGATLYHALTLQIPFSGRTPTELLSQIESGKTPLLRTRHRRFSRDLETIIAKAMEPSPERRYVTADELADDLERLLNLQPIKAKPATLATRTWKAVRRNRASLVGVFIGSVMALSLAAAVAAYFLAVPRWVNHHVDQARLTLLHPDQSNQIFSALFWNQPQELRPSDSVGSLTKALEHYQAAIQLSPLNDALRKERDVVRCALRALSQSGNEVRDQRDASGFSNDPRSQGLFRLLIGDAPGALDNWSQLDPLTGSDPFVDAALGVLHLANGEPARAYPRLQRAVEAFPNVSFLTQYLADAAIQCGDIRRAERLIELARSQPLQDRLGGLNRLTADLYAAQGRPVVEVNAEYARGFTFYSPIAILHHARFLQSHGEWEDAVHEYFRLARSIPHSSRAHKLFAEALEHWWRSLDATARLQQVRGSLDLPEKDSGALAVLLAAYTPTTEFSPTLSRPNSSPYLQRDAVSLETLAGRMEVENVERWNSLIKLPSVMKDWLAESWLSTAPTVKGRFALWCACVVQTVGDVIHGVRLTIMGKGLTTVHHARGLASKSSTRATSHMLVASFLATAVANAQTNLDYDFESLVVNQLLVGQDTWESSPGASSPGVELGNGFNVSTVASGRGIPENESAFRPHSVPFLYSANDPAVVWSAWARLAPSGTNENAIVNVFGVPGGAGEILYGLQKFGADSFSTPFFYSPATGNLLGDHLVPNDHWYEFRVSIDFSQVGGRATLSYRDLTLGESNFTNDGVIQNISTGLNQDCLGYYLFYGVKIRCDVSSSVDNIHFDAPSDADGDGVPNGIDGCPTLASVSQSDSDNDGVGNDCDNCPYISNTCQEDSDENGIGDACEALCPTPGFTGLGDLPGGDVFSRAFGVSADGTTVVGYSTSSNGASEAFRWRVDTMMVGLGDLPGAGFNSIAYRVSADGSTIAGNGSSGNSFNGMEAFIWSEDDGMVGLGGISNGASNANSISNDGTIVGGTTFTGDGASASIWTVANGWTVMEAVSGLSTTTYGLSRDGNWLTGVTSNNEAFLASEGTGFQVIGDLPGGSTYAFGNSVADSGIVVGLGSSPAGTEAFLWSNTNGIVGLGDLTGGPFDSDAIDISEDGSLIVGYGSSAAGHEAVLWDEALVIHRVVDLLTENGVSIPCGWFLTQTNDITINCGVVTVVGDAINASGNTEGWIASYIPGSPPVTPASCDDGNACTINDVCASGACAGTPINIAVDCDDDNECTNDGCNPATGCTHTNNTVSCDDNDSCTINDACTGGVCAGTPPRPWGDITPADCDPVVSGCNVVNIDDILCVLTSFAGNYSCAGGLAFADIVPCAGNGVINLDDILGVLNAFTGANACPCVP